MSTPRIAIVFEYGTLNGGEYSMLSVLDCLAANGAFEFVAIAPEEGRLAGALEERGIEQVPVTLRVASGTRLPRETVCTNLLKTIQKCAPDLVHANSLAMGRLTGAIADQLDIPCLAHLRDIIKLSKAAIADLNRNRLLIAVSRATQDFHVAQGLDAEKTRTVYNGVDCNHFQPRPATGFLKRELQLDEEAFLVATIGQIGLRKAQDVLTDAAIAIAEKVPHVHYLLIGERNSSKQESIEFEENITTRFTDAGLTNHLHHLGYRNDINLLLNEINLLVHPAKQEPLGRVLLEAAASGVPIIATQVGGTEEILRDGESALLVPAADAPALGKAIVEMCGDVGLRKRLGTAGRKRIQAEFRVQVAAENLADVWINN